MLYIKNEVISNCKVIRTAEDRWITNPTEEQILANGWERYNPPTPTPYTPTYEEKVVNAIREKYTIDDELAILRQRDTKPEEFAEYNAFCEECKVKARE